MRGLFRAQEGCSGVRDATTQMGRESRCSLAPSAKGCRYAPGQLPHRDVLTIERRKALLQRRDLRQIVGRDVRAIRMQHRVMLMVVLGRIERTERSDLRHDWSREGFGV